MHILPNVLNYVFPQENAEPAGVTQENPSEVSLPKDEKKESENVTPLGNVVDLDMTPYEIIMDVSDTTNDVCDDGNSMQVLQSLPVSEPTYDIPFKLLAGEKVVHYGHLDSGVIALTNYRLYLQCTEVQNHIPLGLLEAIEQRDLFFLQISCKDGRTYRCSFETNDLASEWYNRLIKAIEPPKQLNQVFAFTHYEAQEKDKDDPGSVMIHAFEKSLFDREMKRMGFSGDCWRISEANANFKLCPTYPPFLLVPSCISDDKLENVAKFRSSRRIPAVVWRHSENGAVIARCSQPEIGFFGWRSNDDEELIKAISDACNFWNHKANTQELDRPITPALQNGNSKNECLGIPADSNKDTNKKVLIIDARSYAIALANRARGGGCECLDYYPNCSIEFMCLANIHSIRKSFHSLRLLCGSAADQQNWFSQLESTKWLYYLAGLMKAAVTVVTAVEREARPVLVHCSDGWDRTPQIVSLAELMLDPYYRTMEGFKTLIEREWLSFGHKFADRCGHTTGSEDLNERCPVFLQWLDGVHQIHLQFPCSFEFNHTYLIKLAQHTYSNLFGTFLCNTQHERRSKHVYTSTFSVWDFLNTVRYKNHLYKPPGVDITSKVLWPEVNIRDLNLWSEVYLGSLESNAGMQGGSCPGPPRTAPAMTKTRSYGDLRNTIETSPGHFRRSSDPNINVDVIVPEAGAAASTPQELSPNRDLSTPEESARPMDSSTPQKEIIALQEFAPMQQPLNPDELFPVQPSLFEQHFSPQQATTSHQQSENPQNLTSAQNSNLNSLNPSQSSIPCQTVDPVQNINSAQALDHVQNLNPIEDEPQAELLVPQRQSTLNEADFLVKTLDVDPDFIPGDPLPIAEVKSVAHEFLDDPSRNGLIKSVNSAKDCLETEDVDVFDGQDIVIENGDKTETDDEECDLTVRGLDDEDEKVNSEGGARAITPDLIEESKAECSGGGDVVSVIGGTLRSVETSTDTLVSDNVISSSYKELMSGFEKLHVPVEPLEPQEESGRTLHDRSRTSSASDWDNCLNALPTPQPPPPACPLGDDGLVPLRSAVQERLLEIIQEHRRKEELLQRELHVYRVKLARQVCHKCNYSEAEKPDDNVSVVESVCSAGEGHTSAVESLRSESSWEPLEEAAAYAECAGTLWVPDHAVSRCMGCDTKFWLGKRKHHCRNCGRIFCADCSENSAPLPSEQLYDPVRVCTGCYSKLRRDCGEVPDQCKHYQPQTTNNNPQIAASSN